MRIGVIIPSYNRAGMIRRAIDSVLKQTCQANEIIVVDDGSNDGTEELIAAAYPEVKLLTTAHMGVSHARNIGIQHSHADWIALLDSDDEWHPEKLQKQIAYIQQHNDAVLLHTNEIWIRNGSRVNPHEKHKKSGGYIYKQCLPLCCISPSSVIIKRSLFDDLGMFDESLPACEDYDLWLRICARYPVDYINEALITKYGGHDDQLSQKHWGMDRFRIQSLENILKSKILNLEDKMATRDMLIHKLEILLRGADKHNNHSVLKKYQPLLQQLNRTETGQSSEMQ